ncbi:hypothetical protein QPA20_001633 [Campylobacter upsaliensis]|nr:hypothetical protein [Campylobacter upsaliensis]
MSKAKKLHKKARLNLTPFVWRRRKVKQGQARSSKVKQGQARSSKVKQGQARSSKVKRVAAEANSPEAARQIHAKWQGKFKPNLAKPKKLFLKAKSQKIGAKRYIGAKLNLVS